RADKEDLAASLARVRDFAGVNLVVEWRALEAAGINADAPVTVSVRDLPVRRVLRLILRDVGGGNINLSYAADDGVLTVSTADALWRNTVTRVYDVRDLLVMDWPGDFRGAPLEAFGIHQSHPPPPEPVATYQERMDSIVRLIQESIDPTTWRNAGGSVGGIHSFGGRLVITTTPDYHAEVEWLLGLLRQR
ncbi:MAG TPA: hypothetical protein VK986_08975, partial [Tepidisphaeraceae bacterium]|nr:hypothetical protein [Tepidisphaeraceae bacterium]